MPAPLNVDREAVRVLVVAIGPRAAAREMGLDENTVLQWSARGNWLANAGTRVQPLPKSMQPREVIGVINPAQALQNLLVEDGGKVKTAAMRYARRTTEHAANIAESAPDQALAMASDVKSVVQTAAIAGGWAAGDTGTSVVLNIALIGQALPEV